jgi:hypothetical protein
VIGLVRFSCTAHGVAAKSTSAYSTFDTYDENNIPRSAAFRNVWCISVTSGSGDSDWPIAPHSSAILAVRQAAPISARRSWMQSCRSRECAVGNQRHCLFRSAQRDVRGRHWLAGAVGIARTIKKNSRSDASLAQRTWVTTHRRQ